MSRICGAQTPGTSREPVAQQGVRTTIGTAAQLLSPDCRLAGPLSPARLRARNRLTFVEATELQLHPHPSNRGSPPSMIDPNPMPAVGGEYLNAQLQITAK